MGYHKRTIPRGEYGKFSKIIEEFEELLDSHERNVKIMELTELSDLYGAIKGYLEKEYQLTMSDLQIMDEVTAEAFRDGTRVARTPDVSGERSLSTTHQTLEINNNE